MAWVEREATLGGVIVERDVPTAMRDGTVLRADVCRPETPGEYPVLLQRTPYDKTVAQPIVFQHPAWYARQGYVVVQDPRGRFASEGDFAPFDSARLVADPSLSANQALVTAEGRGGRLSFRLENVPTADPRTSSITAYSVLATLERLCRSPVVPA